MLKTAADLVRQHLVKLAEYALMPHQQSVIDRLSDPDINGVLAFHGLGSGKTLTSIAAADQLGLPSDVIVPAALQANYTKEILKHLGKIPKDISVRSYNKAVSAPAEGSDGLVVVDEAHNLGRSDSARSKLFDNLHPYHKLLLLTGTPIRNDPSELAPLVNALYQKHVVPVDKQEFYKKFVSENVVSPGLVDRFYHGVTPGVTYDIKNADKLRQLLAGRVDYYNSQESPESAGDFPTTSIKNVNVPMSDTQKRVYDFVTSKMPRGMLSKMQNLLPPSKSELGQLNSFLQAARQVADNPATYDAGGFGTKPEDATKIMAAVANVRDRLKQNQNFKTLVYSNYLDSALKPYAAQLDRANIAHGLVTGDIPFKTRKQTVDDYNTGKLRALLISAAGAEGLDLKGTNLVQLLEPHWNNERLNQAIGRAVRYKSHADMAPEDRNVEIERYTSTLPQGPWDKLLGHDAPKSVDEYLTMLSDKKQELNYKFLKVLQEASMLPAAK